MKMNKINIHCIITFMLLCAFTSWAEQNAALSTTNAPPIVVTNLVTAINAMHDIPKLWPSHRREYANSANQILNVFSQHEENPDAQKAVRKLLDDVIALQTVYGGAIDNQYLAAKQILLSAFFYNRTMNTDPEKWLALAKFVGQMRSEIKSIDYEAHRRVTRDGKTYLRPNPTPNPTPEDHKSRYLGNYQGELKRSINDLIRIMEHNAYKAKFADNSKREEYNENLVKFSHFPEEDVALSKTNALPIVVSNLATAVQAVNKLPDFWQSHWGEYVKTVEQILDIFSQHEENPEVQKAVRKLFDDVIALQTVYDGAKDNQYLWYKRTALMRLTLKSQIINTDPEKWLALAKFVGQMKDEVKPADYWSRMEREKRMEKNNAEKNNAETNETETLVTMNGISYKAVKVSSYVDTSHDVIANGYKKINFHNYQEILRLVIKDLTENLATHAHKAEFDDDSKRKEYKKNLVKFAQLSEEDANKMDVTKRNKDIPLVANPTKTTEPEK